MIVNGKYLIKALFKTIGLFGVLLFVSGYSNAQSVLKDGIWRGELQRADGQQVVFNFSVSDSDSRTVIYIFNAEEHLRVDKIETKGDSVFIQMPFFDSYFALKNINGNKLTGIWTKNYGTRLERMPFMAIYGDSSRMESYKPSRVDVSGSWATKVGHGKQGFSAIGLFKQNGIRVTGTFLTPSGDYRFLDGVMSGDTLKLSGFDGGHALLFTAIADGDSLIDGRMYSINSVLATWAAARKNYKILPAAYDIDNIKPGSVKLNFKLKDMRNDKVVSLNDPKYKDKVVILQLLGSWCPNCYDETPFLIDYYKKNRQRGVELIAVDFERTENYAESKRTMNAFLNRFDFEYPVVFSGVAATDTALTQKVFPGLPVEIKAFPSLIFIDKSGFVRKVHSGFNGPATGIYYDEFKEEFDSVVNSLLAE